MLCMRRFEGWGRIDFAAVHQSAVDAVDGSSTGTRVP
jgi:hypothetical protein